MRIIFLLFFLYSFLYSLDVHTSKKIAQNFLEYKKIDKSIISYEKLTHEDKTLAYIFNLENNGYIIIPTSQNFSPIKAYSFKSNFSNFPEVFKTFLKNDLYEDDSISHTYNSVIDQKWFFFTKL